MNQHETETPHFALENARFLDSAQIWLALDDSLHESRRTLPDHAIGNERLSLFESELFHRQLFYWLLIRKGPCVFPDACPLHEGVPQSLHWQN